jgi:hypothetical protein
MFSKLRQLNAHSQPPVYKAIPFQLHREFYNKHMKQQASPVLLPTNKAGKPFNM